MAVIRIQRPDECVETLRGVLVDLPPQGRKPRILLDHVFRNVHGIEHMQQMKFRVGLPGHPQPVENGLATGFREIG